MKFSIPGKDSEDDSVVKSVVFYKMGV